MVVLCVLWRCLFHMVDEVEGKRGCDDIFLIRMFHCTAPIEVNSITCT